MNLYWDALQQHWEKAHSMVDLISVADVAFSGSTYQVGIKEGSETAWVVLQLAFEPDAKLSSYPVQDVFCSCAEATGQNCCWHMATAYLFLLRFGYTPPHIYFDNSTWKVAFQGVLIDHGTEAFELQREPKKLTLVRKRKPIIEISSSQKELDQLQELLERPEETEDSSIKFSSLSDDELQRWRVGRATKKLRIELSPVTDIAKRLSLVEQLLQLPATYTLTQEWQLEISLEGYALTLNGEAEETKKAVEQSIAKHQIKIEKLDLAKGEITIQKGCSAPILLNDAHTIGLLFDRYGPTLKRYFKKQGFSLEPQSLQWAFNVAKEGITLTCYQHEPGDLDSARFFGRWVYLEKNLFPTEPSPLKKPQLFIPAAKVPSFLQQCRFWLERIPGMSVHINTAEEQVQFSIDKNGALWFSKAPAKKKLPTGTIQFDEFLWVPKRGFFLSEATSTLLPLPFGTPIAPYHVADFIRTHRTVLEQIPGFFAHTTPLYTAKLLVRYTSAGEVSIESKVMWDQNIEEGSVRAFDDFFYVPNHGFVHAPLLSSQLAQERTILSNDQEAWEHFFTLGLHHLEQEFSVQTDPHLVPPQNLLLIASNIEEKELKEKSVQQLWRMNLSWESEKGVVTLQEVLEGKRRRMRFLPTKAGLLDLQDKRFAWLSFISKGQPKGQKEPREKKEHLELTPLELLRLQAHDQIAFRDEERTDEFSPSRVIERLLKLEAPKPPCTTLLQSELRSYQQIGLNWLWYIYCNSLSGLLCDDMGVGKTHQAMGLLAAAKYKAVQESKRVRFLIICPTSLVWHWKEKLQQFVPTVEVLPYFGTTRSITELQNAELLLTTYGIWRNERETLKEFQFDIAIFDELQIAKNHSSLIWAALTDVKAKMRLGLTGTPIENELRELKSLFDLILPGYMPADAEFRELFIRPIERSAHNGHKELLARYVHPFILRRRKQDVLKELPEKIEEICHVELVGEQKNLYKSVAASHGLQLLNILKDSTNSVPYMHIFALLSALKQISNHPAVYLKDVEGYEKYESGKWNVFQELIEEAEESGLKIVIFSQFLLMLDIMAKYFTQRGIGFAQIRGQTKRRGAEISRFQHDPKCRVFLGSLQAAGLGIDLTAGSIVIHYDRWWNAARENQATDRVHRIGQERGVQVYKLVTLNTIEERIDQMILRKSQLLEDVVRWDDHQIIKRLSRNEIIELLEGLNLKS